MLQLHPVLGEERELGTYSSRSVLEVPSNPDHSVVGLWCGDVSLQNPLLMGNLAFDLPAKQC